MESYTVTKEQLLTLVKMKKEQIDEDIRLRVTKKDIGKNAEIDPSSSE
jgi:hypothetical protein